LEKSADHPSSLDQHEVGSPACNLSGREESG